MKKLNKFLSVMIVVCILFSSGTAVFAAENNFAKEEVVYIMANSDGSIKNVYVVNIFNGGEVIDYGKYSEVKMLTTNDPININGDSVTFSSTAEKVYYQGKMERAEIPWDISIRYYLDDEEYTPTDIAGKSGNLKIKLRIDKNNNYDGTFYDDFAIQAAVLLDTNKASNIIAEGSTTANVGKNKQILYTVLPGDGLEAEISADVVDFEMDSVEINGINLNLNIDIDTSGITSEVTRLQDGISELNEGATELRDGSKTLKDASSTLKNGTTELNNGTIELKDGASLLNNGVLRLQEGSEEIQNGLNTLNEQSGELISGSAQFNTGLKEVQEALLQVSSTADDISQLTSASTQIKEGIEELYESVNQLHQNIGYTQYKAVMAQNGLNIEQLKEMNTETIDTLNDQIAELQEKLSIIGGVEGQEEKVLQLQKQIDQLSDIVQLIIANNGAINGTESYLNSLEIATGQLLEGVSGLKTKYKEFDVGIQHLAASLSDMIYNMNSLSEGINKLVSEYSKLDNGIIEYTQGVKALADGYSEIVVGMSEISRGSRELKIGAGEISVGMNELVNGLFELNDGVNELYQGSIKITDGTTELWDETYDLDTRIEDKINEMLSDVQGEETELKSFTSSKNTNVKSVQFVYRTDAIEKLENTSETITVEESLNFWQKLLRLFGLH